MRSICALSFTPAVQHWLMHSRHSHVLHIFDHVCNLINQRREVLSIVTPQIGNGPFNLVIENGIRFSEHVNLQSSISIHHNQLNFENLTINVENAAFWSPRPNWELLHDRRDVILDQLTQLQITNYQFSNPLISAIATADLSSALTAAQQLAGLGLGLTPSGDDFLLGAMYAAWILHPPEIASVLVQEIANTAAPLTTSLSAAYLKAGSRGEAGAIWHDFFNAVSIVDTATVQLQVAKILSIGHTSGADALAGFINSMLANKTHSAAV